mmetsp:Transcript_111203/g.208466  ORF Transcript_111203/g.208466 Transcript_111203/m.208466 type:complete len:385 (+) Transcript_111203:112-1266(+)
MQGPPVLPGQSPDQNQLAAMMWQMQMASQQPAQPLMMPPWPPAMPMGSPQLKVKVEGLTFEYQLTDDDVRKVFARYGEVFHVTVDKDGTSAMVQFEHPHQAMAAQSDLDRKQLAGMSGAYLRVDFAQQQFDSTLAQMAAASATQQFPPMLPTGMPGYPPVMPGVPPVPGAGSAQAPADAHGAHPKKYTCKLEVGIENEGEFRVGSRTIQIARQIWQDQKFQESGGKTRLRGKGIGGPHEAEEPLALCISCRDKAAFDRAVQYAEAQLQKVHNDYKAWCAQNGHPVPELSLKVSKKGSNFTGPSDLSMFGGVDPPRGERPLGAPTDEEIEKLIEKRNEARKCANYKEADEVREFLKEHGVVLMDEKNAKGNFKGKEVTKWRFWRP